jgi:solute carrier family 25 aspartate/glutamate transporter 12/13
MNYLLSDMEQLKKIYLQASGGRTAQEVTKDEFLSAANTLTHISPLEIEILFKLCEIVHESPTIILSDLQSISPEQYYKKVTQRVLDIKAVDCPEDRSLFIVFLESAYRFGLATVAGCVEAIGTYPMDLVKTRMQAQRYIPEKKLYGSTHDCLYKVWKYEGVPGLYRGLFSHILAVSLGKALKLTVSCPYWKWNWLSTI